jgi:glycosyltransferase involved in cell wall biosynthesis
MNTQPHPLRIAHVGPVATSIPPPQSTSIELLTSLLTEGLVARGHQVTLFATATSRTSATLHATFSQGYWEDHTMWPWELCEMLNLAAAVERAPEFDIIHYQAMYAPISLAFSRLASTPLVQTIHHAPNPTEVALWSRYPDAPFIAIAREQARLLSGLNVIATVHHGIDTSAFRYRDQPDDYLVFLGRFMAEKGVLEAIDIARRTGMRLLMAGAENDYYRTVVAPHVDGRLIVYAGEVDHAGKVALLGAARALVFPVQRAEAFGLVMLEAMACGTPVAALNRGAVPEIVENGLTGVVFSSLDELVDGLPRVLAIDRRRVHSRVVERFGIDRMVDEYVAAYRHLIAAGAARSGQSASGGASGNRMQNR